MFGNAWFGDWLIRLGAFAVGFNQQQLDMIAKQMPNLHKLIVIAKQLQPLAAQAEPLVQQAMPLIEEATKEIGDLLPVLDVVLGVIERDLNAGKARNDAINGIVNKLTHI